MKAKTSRRASPAKSTNTKNAKNTRLKNANAKNAKLKTPTKSRSKTRKNPSSHNRFLSVRWVKNPADFEFFSAKRTYAGQFTIAVLTLILVITGVIFTITSFSISSAIHTSRTGYYSEYASFAAEYPDVSQPSLFTYRSAQAVVNILEHGTGVVFLGFPDCPWCQAYAPKLANLADDVGISKIYYLNIYEDRAKNSEAYQKIVQILGDHLQYDEEGRHRVYVPDAVFVVDGKIVGNDYETSKDLRGADSPEAYWTPERVAVWSGKIRQYLTLVKNASGCADTCNI